MVTKVELVKITKFDVVSRQLTAAVTLFFQGGDLVVIHTLVAAAHQILVALGKTRGIGSIVKNTAGLSQSEMPEFLRTINYPFNFFKHADRDSDDRINIGPLPRFTQDFIMDAVVMLQRLTGDIPFEAKVFWHWFVSKYPQEFDNLPQDGEIAKMQQLRMADMSFDKILALIKLNDIIPRT